MSADAMKIPIRSSRATLLVLVLLSIICLLAVYFVERSKPPGGKWIGELESSRSELAEAGLLSCPEGWLPLFGDRESPVLRRYCVTETSSRKERVGLCSNPSESDLAWDAAFRRRWQEQGPFEKVYRDCPVVGLAAPTAFDQYLEPLRNRFKDEAIGASVPLPGSRPPRLAIIDSVRDSSNPANESCPRQTDLGAFECSPHGWALANLAEDLMLGLSTRIEITSRRALTGTYEIQAEGSDAKPESFDIGEAGGGLYGYIQDLASAIEREVTDWSSLGEERGGLILNLSLGWEASAQIDASAVRDAIRVAVCRGALVVAAAGNRVSGDPATVNTQLLPAAWEQDPAPTNQECEDLLGELPPSVFNLNAPYRPLVFAAGGVQADNRPLSNSRPNATPRLVAFGDHAPVEHPDPACDNPNADELLEMPCTETLTGTSVSALVVSVAAAVRWQDFPSRNSFQIMEDLWQGGEGIGQPADFCLGTAPCQEVRRVRLGTAWSLLPPQWTPDPPEVTQSVITGLAQPGFFSGPVSTPCVPASVWTYGLGGPPVGQLCPQGVADIRTLAEVGPQPGPNHNPNCTYFENNSSRELVLEFDPRFRIYGMPVEVSDFTLLVAGESYRLPGASCTLGAIPAEPPCRIVLENLQFPDIYPMYLAVTVTQGGDQHAVITPILQVIS